MTALYIHWPFCKAKCPYCDFNSHVRDGVDAARWQSAMLAELRTMAAWMPDARLSSIFFGGGTPSLMPPQLVEALIERAEALLGFEDGIEITLEANPTSVEAAKLKGFRDAGVNRVSLGVQSLRAENMRFLGREHSASEALKAVDLAHSLFDRFSFDLIYALPNQTAPAWEKELGEALKYVGEHLSLYQLTIEPNTAFHHDYHVKKAFKLPKDTLARELFLLTQNMMDAAGLPAYEISNHARLGQESRHNLTYWRGGAYLGVGAGAHGRIVSANLPLAVASGQMGGPLSRAHGCSTSQKNWHATQTLKSPERWLERTEQDGHALEHCIAIAEDERAQEQVLTGLRLREGIALGADVRAQLNRDKVSFYAEQGLLVLDENRLRATPQGWLVLNALLADILV
jgi:putative oxygen-independent coproporphyrinogen III oxidase